MFSVKKVNLNQIEANVVIQIINVSQGCGRLIHLWECEKTLMELHFEAAQWAHQFGEEVGSDMVSYQIHDFRE